MSGQTAVTKKELTAALEKALGDRGDKNFTESVEVVITTEGFDVSKPENRIRETIVLPNPTPKTRKVCIFAEGVVKDRAEKAGADRVIVSRELDSLAQNRKKAKKIAKAYDFFLAEARLIGKVGKILGFTLGPKGKAPAVITPSTDLTKEIGDLKRAVRFYLRNRPEAACAVGQVSMKPEKLAENAAKVISSFEETLGKRGRLEHIYVKTTMGGPVRVA
ncbi:MAG: 50S ribosomal protein L1 [Candidatus Geothermarchaeales archaeon]